MKALICSAAVISLYFFTNLSSAVDIIECEDEQGNKTFAQQCPPGSKAVNRRSYSTVTADAAATGTSVSATLYVVPACDTCDQVREFLDIRKISVTEKDISKDVELQNELKEKTGGDLRVPVVLIGDKVLSGYNRASLQEALAAAGYQEPEATPTQ
jgi:glutaredoxin